ncbi:uncharacterized protein ACBR49_009445 isoform 1-T2 [Aulostomus maculatus]
MGQLFSSEEEFSHLKDAVGSLLYRAMLEGGAVPNLGVVHPLLLASHDEDADSGACLREQLQKLQVDFGNRAPTYLRDLIGRLSSFSDEPRLAGLLGSVVTMVMDMAYTSSKQPSAVKGKSVGSSSCQRVWELQEVMEEYLKRCRIHLSDKTRLIQDSVRLEAQFSFTLTQLKTCLIGGDCDSRSLRHWASGAAFHTQMLVHLAALEGRTEPLAARAALQQYTEDLAHIVPVYRRYKSNTVCVVKCRGGLQPSCDPTNEVLDEGSMTGLTVTDRETGKSATITLAAMEVETGRRGESRLDSAAASSASFNPDVVTSDQYALAYLDYLFSEKGPVAELENFFTVAGENLRMLRTEAACMKRKGKGQSDGVKPNDGIDGVNRENTVERREPKEMQQRDRPDDGLKLSITETQQQQQDLHLSLHQE